MDNNLRPCDRKEPGSMSNVLTDISEIRDAAEDCQTFSRLAIEERDPEKKRKWQAKARMSMGVVRAKTALVDAEIGGWR